MIARAGLVLALLLGLAPLAGAAGEPAVAAATEPVLKQLEAFRRLLGPPPPARPQRLPSARGAPPRSLPG